MKTAASKPSTMESAVFKVGELATRWGVAKQHVSDIIEAGQLQALDLAGKGTTRRLWRIPREAVARFEKVNSNLFDRRTGKLLPARPVTSRK